MPHSRPQRLLQLAEQARAALDRRHAQASTTPASSPPPPRIGHHGETPSAEQNSPAEK